MSAQHGSAVAREGVGVLIVGASGSGKSQLALELMALGAELVADDGVLLKNDAAGVSLCCPASIKGVIEARGVGLLSVNAIDQARLAIVVDMDKTVTQRLPAPKSIAILGVEVPLVHGKNCVGLSAVVWCLLGGGQILPSD